jgi:hypothetical protein
MPFKLKQKKVIDKAYLEKGERRSFHCHQSIFLAFSSSLFQLELVLEIYMVHFQLSDRETYCMSTSFFSFKDLKINSNLWLRDIDKDESRNMDATIELFSFFIAPSFPPCAVVHSILVHLCKSAIQIRKLGFGDFKSPLLSTAAQLPVFFF